MDSTKTEYFDYIVIGAGPAGLSSAQYAARGGLRTLVLDVAGAGGQVSNIDQLENYPGVFPSVNGTDFMEVMKDQAESFGAKIVSKEVKDIQKKEGLFIVQTRKISYEAKYICIATGAVHRKLGVPGEEEFEGRGVSYCAVCDGPFFKGKKILVVGGGDSACSEALYLSKISDDVKIIHRRDRFRAQKAVVDRMLQSGINPIYNTVVESINGTQKVESVIVSDTATGEVTQIEADAVFVFAGMLPCSGLLSELKKDESGYIITDEKMETSIEGVFAAGDVRSKEFRQIVTAVSDGAIAAHSAVSRHISFQ